jgi:hypothetical protein
MFNIGLISKTYSFCSGKLKKINNSSYSKLNKHIQNILKEIKHYQRKWIPHVKRMDTNRIPKQTLHYGSKGRRNIGQQRKRWRDQLHLED